VILSIVRREDAALPARGQSCFDFLELVVHVLVPRPAPGPRRARAARVAALEIQWHRPASRAPIRSPRLRVAKQRKMVAGPPPRSIGMTRMTAAELAETERDITDLMRTGDYNRPMTVADCPTGPCPWFSCSMNLYLFVDRSHGTLKIVFPDKDFDELEETCALRVANLQTGDGLLPFEVIARLQNFTLERASKIADAAMEKLKSGLQKLRDDDDID
jgi:hypothetical protein